MKTLGIAFIILAVCAVVSFFVTILVRRRRENMSQRLLAGFLCFMGQKYHEAHWQVMHASRVAAADQANEIVRMMGECRIRAELMSFLEEAPIFISDYRYPHHEENTRKFLDKLCPLLESTHKDYKSRKKGIEEVLEEFSARFSDVVKTSLTN